MAKTKITKKKVSHEEKLLKELLFIEKWARQWFFDWGHKKRDKMYQKRIVNSLFRISHLRRMAQKKKARA